MLNMMMRADSVARQNAPRQFKSRDGRQIDVENADIGLFGDKHLLAALGVGGFQYHDIDRRQRTTHGNPKPRWDDRRRSEHASALVQTPVSTLVALHQTNETNIRSLATTGARLCISGAIAVRFD